jgi:hypothetical protein
MDGESAPVGQMFASLSPEKRAERYRQFAAKTMEKAQAATSAESHAEYLTMAAGWHTLAVEAERMAGNDPRDNSDATQGTPSPGSH